MQRSTVIVQNTRTTFTSFQPESSKMVMNRCHFENSFACQFKRKHLYHNRHASTT